jgi:hypothetical protein
VAAAVVFLDAAPYLADAQGKIFKRARLDTDEADGLPVVTGVDRGVFAADPSAGEAEVRRALLLAARWRENASRPALGEIHLGRDATTLFTWDGAVAVRLGASEPGEGFTARLERFDVVWGALASEERARARSIHLSSTARPDRVTVRLADAR